MERKKAWRREAEASSHHSLGRTGLGWGWGVAGPPLTAALRAPSFLGCDLVLALLPPLTPLFEGEWGAGEWFLQVSPSGPRAPGGPPAHWLSTTAQPTRRAASACGQKAHSGCRGPGGGRAGPPLGCRPSALISVSKQAGVSNSIQAPCSVRQGREKHRWGHLTTGCLLVGGGPPASQPAPSYPFPSTPSTPFTPASLPASFTPLGLGPGWLLLQPPPLLGTFPPLGSDEDTSILTVRLPTTSRSKPS